MDIWPLLELTDYERRFVGVYENGDKEGVLRRSYEVSFNTIANSGIPGLEQVNLSGSVAITRRTRVFALTFAGNLGSWRLKIETASGEQMTPQGNSDGPPIVSSMIAGSSWNALSALGDQSVVNALTAGVTTMFGSYCNAPLLIDPNWELSPNETLFFRGTPIDNQATTTNPMTPPAQKLLMVGVHVWEFPGMDGQGTRMGGGPKLGSKTSVKKAKR